MIFHIVSGVMPGESLAELQQTLKSWAPGLITFGIKLLIALVIFFIGTRIIKIIYRTLNRSFKRVDMEVSLRKFLLSVLNAAMYCLLAFTIAGQIGVNSASIVALLGSVSIAVGLAVQGSLANFAGGVLILLMKPFRVGDYIVSKDGEGTVSTIGLVYTVLNTVDNKQVVIPNGTLSNSPMTNVTAMDKRRLDVLVGIGYHSDLKKAKEIMGDIFYSQKGILKEEPIDILVSDLTENAVTIAGRGWISTDDYWPARWEILERVKLEFEAAGIEIPHSRLEVQLEERSSGKK